MKEWLKKRCITNTIAERLLCETGTIIKLYALPKLHKRDIPSRPIILACNSPSFQLSKFYHIILSNVTGMKNSYIKNSQDFVEKVRDKIIPESFTLISLDVFSLFTNIPFSLVNKIIHTRWPIIRQYTSIPEHQVLEDLSLIFEYSSFSFQMSFINRLLVHPWGLL